MKLSLILLLFGLQAAATGFSQKVTLKVKTEKLGKVLSRIEKQTGYRFTYSAQVVPVDEPVTLEVNNEELTKVLDILFKETSLNYRVESNKIIIVYEKELKTTVTQSLAATTDEAAFAVDIKGRVVNEKGDPLEGVTITVKGTSTSSVTKKDGLFSVNADNENATLQVSYVGYADQEVAVGGSKNFIIIELKPVINNLNEVVVIGYGNQKKKDITSAIATVSVKDIANRPIVNVVEAITGKAAGVQIAVPSGAPGGALSVRVRGVGSPNGGEPLYVVDGVLANNISAIDPNNIESISVLKDASAAGIYGAAGSTNGVVIITTKQGTKGKPSTDFSFYTAQQRVVKKLDMLSNADYLALQQEIDGAPITVAPYYDVQNTNNEWQDLIYRNAPQTGVNIGTSGGSENGKFYLGLGYLNQKGIIDNSNFERYSAKFSAEQNITKYLKIGAGINYNRTNQKDVPDNLSANFGGVVTSALVTAKYVPIFYGPTSPFPGVYGTNNLVSGENPVSILFASQNNSVGNNILGNTFIEVVLPFNVKLKSQFNVVLNNNKRDFFQDPFASLSGIPTRGAANSNYNEVFRWGLDNTLSWKKSFDKHSVDVVAGTASLKENIANSFQSAQGFGSNAITSLNAASSNFTVSTSNFDWSTNSYFGRINYGFDDRYLFTATIRRDGSSRVGTNSRWGNFPAFSAGWKVSNEKFMEGVTWVTDLKIRGGWGKTGNLPPYTLLYPSYSLLNAGAPYAYNGGAASSGVNPGSQLGNSNLKWESAAQTNIGFDASFFKNRLTVSVDYYKKGVEDLIFTQQLPQTTGGSITALNLPGFNTNKGIEISLDGAIVKQKDMDWSSNFNISFNKNNVEGIDETISFQTGAVQVAGSRVNLYTQIIKNNYALGTFWGYKSKGVDPSTGNLIYGNDLEKIGNALPKYTFGFTNNFRYRNLSLSVLIDGTQGNDIYNGLRMETEAMTGFANQSTAVLNRWKKSGDVTDIPRAAGNRGSNAAEAAKLQNRISSHYIEDGSFIRFRNVTLGYSIDKKVISRLGLAGAKIYVTAQNIFTFTNYSGYYPEVNAFGQGTNNQASSAGSGISLLSLGIDRGTYPAAKTFTVGVNVQF